MIKIQKDLTIAIARLAKYKKLKAAAKLGLTEWATQSVKHVKQARLLKTRTGFLYRNIGFEVTDNLNAAVGTGVGRAKGVVYASILDEGGVIKPKHKQWLTIPFKGVLGSAHNYRGASFVFKSKKGNLIIATKIGGKLHPLFTLKKQVTIPRKDWFTLPMSQMKPTLALVTSAEYQKKLMEKM